MKQIDMSRENGDSLAYQVKGGYMWMQQENIWYVKKLGMHHA